MKNYDLVVSAVTRNSRIPNKNQVMNEILHSFKELAQLFKEIPEIGKFDELVIEMNSPLKNSAIKKAWVILKPSAAKNDYRTRILSYVAESPVVEGSTREVTYITGNKYAIDSALKDKRRISEFKSFLKDCENFFISMSR